MTAQPKYIPHYTYEEYCQWEGRWELIDGLPIAMSPLPVADHQTAGGNLYAIFKQALKSSCADSRAYLPLDWKIKDDTILQPDFLIACDKLTKGYLDFPPVLVAEILSPSTAIKDRNAKFSIYESQKVKYYLILDVGLKKMEIYELVDDKYQPAAISPASWDFTFHQNCVVPVSFDELWD